MLFRRHCGRYLDVNLKRQLAVVWNASQTSFETLLDAQIGRVPFEVSKSRLRPCHSVLSRVPKRRLICSGWSLVFFRGLENSHLADFTNVLRANF